MQKKTRMSTRLLSLFLSILMVVSLLPMTVFAQPEETSIDTRETMEITDEDLKSNEYETYYYSEDIAYTYQGDLVSFINEDQIQAGKKTYNLKNKKTEVSVNTEESGDVTVDLTNISVPVGQISGQWNVYFGGTVQMVYKTDIPGMEEVRSAESTSAPKTISLTNVPEGVYHLTGGTVYEKANPWSPGHDFGNGTVTEAYFGTLPNITITVGNPAPEGYIGVKTEAKVYDDFENDIWLQYQQKEMKVGDTVNLRPWRVEQIVSDVIHNDVARPNFHFEIIKGDSISLDTTESNQKAVVTAKKPGTSIVKVTYDALEYKGKTWGAISPVNTAYAVFTVGETGTATITANKEFTNWRHYDTIYYKDGETVPYTFTVETENAKSVKVTVNGVEIQGNGNQYTANLENRSNIIGIEATDADGNVKSMYRVIDARFIEVNVANKTSPDEPLKTGDTANISFRGITMPVYKLATIYNPQFGRNATKVTYSNDKLGDFEGKCGQWDLATDNDFDVKFTEAGDFTFHSENGIRCAWWGSELGADITAEGSGEPNLNAPTLMDNFSTLPDFTVHVEDKTAVESVTLSQTEMSLKLGETGQLSATVLPDNATHKEVTWSSSDKEVVSVADGKLTALKAGTATITAEADGKKAECKVTVTAYSLEDVNAAISAIPDASDITLRDKATVENARMLYDNLSDEDKEKVKDVARLTDAEAKIQKLMEIPYIFSLDGTPLKMTQEEANNYRGHYYKVEVPAGTKTVQLERYKNIEVYDQSYNTLISPAANTVNVENIKYGKGNHIILNYDTFWYDYIYFVEEEDSVPVSDITLDKTELTLNKGQSETLTATISPDNATNKKVTWSSNNENVASVDTNGTVTAVKAGEATITAKADGKTAECKVTVTDYSSLEEVNEAISAIPDAKDIKLSDKATVENARKLYDKLSDEDKEKVNDISRLTDAEAKLQELMVIPFAFSLNGTSLKMTQEEANNYRGYYYKVEVPAGTKTVQLERYKDIEVFDQSYHPLIASAATTVNVENINYGKGNYIVLNYDMYWYEYIYFVEAEDSVPVSDIALDKTELTLNEGQSETLTATVLPDNATNKEVTWSSSNESVAVVDANGTVTAVKAGEATITAKADGKTAECKVIVQTGEVVDAGYVTVSVERFTIGQGFYIEPVKVKLEQGQTAMDVVRSLVGENLVTNDAGTYISGIKGADLGADKVEIPAYISEKLNGPTTEDALDMGNYDDDLLEEFDYSNGSGWYYFVNNEAPNVGLADWPLKDGDVVRLQFTVLYGTDLTGIFYGDDKPTVEISNKDNAMVLLAEFNGRDDKDELLQIPAVANAYNDLKTIVQNAVAPQADVDSAVSALENAIEVAKAKAELTALIEQAKEKNEADYTKESFETFKNALDSAEKAVADDNADLTAVSDAKTALEEAMQNLVEKPEVNKDALQTAIEEADKKVKEDYTEESFETFERILESAKAVYANEDATQEEVDNQTALLNAAMTNLVEKTEEPEKPADKSKLESALEKAEALTKADYTEATWNVFADALEKAQSVDKNEKATQEEVDKAVSELESAIDQLEKVKGEEEKPSVKELKALVEKAEKLNKEDYESSNWDSFAQTLESAKAVMNSEKATQAEIDTAKENLQKAMDALVAKTGWQEINGQKYYYGTDGIKKTGWQEIDGKKYYFGDENDGAMKTYWQKIDGKWYFFGNDGVMRTYWQKIWGKWYYLGSANDGAMKTGWQKIWGKWYYLGSANDGAMKTGWQKVYGKWYYLGGAEDGVMKTYWQEINGKWYFFGSADDGAMKTGWQKIWGKWYYLGSANDGAMKTGWQKINGKWYYFGGEQDGSMKSNTWVGDYYVDNSGVWSKTKAKKSR